MTLILPASPNRIALCPTHTIASIGTSIFIPAGILLRYSDPSGYIPKEDEGVLVFGTPTGGDFTRTTLGYKSGGIPDMCHGPNQYPDDWNVGDTAFHEDWADMFMNWVFDSFDLMDNAHGAGIARYNWMQTQMTDFLQN